MLKHLRANLLLLIVTVPVLCVVYPALLWAIGQAAFREKANGSLIYDINGKPIGSRLIAQQFKGKEYFQPRPSAASYNASASGASNYAASNYLLRDRVARTLGPIVRFKGVSPSGKTVQEDIKEWFVRQADPVSEWADAHAGVAQAWVNADDKHRDAVGEWQKTSPDAAAAVAAWKKDNAGKPKPADLAVPFFKSNARAFHASWPALIDDPTWTVAAVFFDAWLAANPHVELKEVPADRVMASGSGLDPDITLENALDQLDRVADAWAEKTKGPREVIRGEIKDLLEHNAEPPLEGLVGVKLVNVLEINVMLGDRYRSRIVAQANP